MYRYEVYGLAISSDVPIPELLPSGCVSAAAEITVSIADRPHLTRTVSHWLVTTASPGGAPWLSWAKVDDGYFLRFHDLADFLIGAHGHSIACVAATEAISGATIRHLVIDHVLPRVLNLLGSDSLHATAVVVNDGVCAFVAEAGTGKSTLAASFHLAGYPAFCDDCLVLRPTRPLSALPAYPGVRLWEESFRALGGAAASVGIPVAQYTAKTRHLGGAEGFRAEPLPLARIYLLERASCDGFAAQASMPQLQYLKPSDALSALIAATFPLDVTDQAMLTRHFRLLSRVAAELPIRRLIMPTDFASLPAVRSLILADCAAA